MDIRGRLWAGCRVAEVQRLLVKPGPPCFEAALHGADAFAKKEAEEPEKDDPEHRPRGIEELRLERDIEPEADVRLEDLRADDADERAPGADANAADDERQRAREDDRAEREPG